MPVWTAGNKTSQHFFFTGIFFWASINIFFYYRDSDEASPGEPGEGEIDDDEEGQDDEEEEEGEEKVELTKSNLAVGVVG